MSSSELHVRPPREGELPAIVALLNEISRAHSGADDTTEDELRLWFTSPTVDAERDIRVVADGSGRLLAYGDVQDEGELHTKIWLDVREHPAAGCAAARALVPVLEGRAREFAALAPPGEKPLVRSYVAAADDGAKRAFEERGYRLIRHSYRMAIDLDADLPEPEWPAGIRVRTFQPGRDDEAVLAVQNEAFSDMWEYVPSELEEWRHYMFGAADFDPRLWFLAVDGEEIAGVALCRHERPGAPGVGWVRVLAVRRPWRRRGIGGALLRHAFRELRARGRTGAGLGVDAGSTTGALELYERAGMRVASRYDLYEAPD